MRKRAILFFTSIFALLFSFSAQSADKPKVEISTVKQISNTVEFSILSNRPFIVGANIYVLNIGNQQFKYSKQAIENGKGILTFLIPTAEFTQLQENNKIYLTYGNILPEGYETFDDMSKQEYRPCWSLGSFSKNLLTK